MRIKGVFYWCLLVFHICKCDSDVKKVEDSREGPRKHQWQVSSSQGSAYSLMSDAVSHAASHDSIYSILFFLRERPGRVHRTAPLHKQESFNQPSINRENISDGSQCTEEDPCPEPVLSDSDKQGLEAIQLLHRQLDDDANGNVDLSESDDFLREELQYDSGYERRQRAFHHNDDMHISARELWEAWLRSEVHNWTVEQTTEWLEKSVELPQYMKTFIDHKVTGATLPRMAVHNMQYLSGVLGIKDPIHKQKIALKAMDVVLFGPPKDSGHRWKDGVLGVLVLGAVFGCWWAYQQSRASRRQMHRMLRDMESLRQAELTLDHLQKELQRARLEQENVATEKQNLERRLLEAGSTSMTLATSYSDLEVSQLKAEIEVLRNELQRAEGELEDRCWAPPAGLQLWLQLTYELENKSHLRKKHHADMQLQTARDACEKLRKKRSSLVGAFVSTHGKSIDDVDRSIVEARTALNEVTQELQERVHRWKQMELLCGFNIINNSGLQYLENALYRNVNGRPNRLRMSSSQDDLDAEESASLYGTSQGAGGSAGLDTLGWKEDSSGSDDLEPTEGRHYPMDLRLAEARAQLEERRMVEERKAQELRSQYLDRIAQYRTHLREARSQPSMVESGGGIAAGDDGGGRGGAAGVEPRSIANGKLRDSIQFTLGGDNVNWTGEDLSGNSLRNQSRSQPQLSRIQMISTRSPPVLGPPANQQRAPQPPPRKNLPPPGPMVRSQSTEAELDGYTEDAQIAPRPISTISSNNRLLNRQATVGSEDGTGSSSSEQSLATAQGDSAQSQGGNNLTLKDGVADNGDMRPRRRKIHFPFAKKTPKVATSMNQS